jgi:hypothetical protein
MKQTVVGVDIAKRVFQLHWLETENGGTFTLQLKREKFLEHFANAHRVSSAWRRVVAPSTGPDNYRD